MQRYLLIASLMALFAGALSARATADVAGTVEEGEFEIVHIYEVDFGDSPKSVTLTVEFTNAWGLTVTLTDLDEFAEDGFGYAVSSNWGSGSETVNFSHTTPVYDGVRYFSVEVYGNPEYEGEIRTNDLSWGAITERGKVAPPYFQPADVDLLGRGKHYMVPFDSAGETVRDMKIDFGPTPQFVTFWGSVESWGEGGAIEVLEVDESGNEQLLNTLQGSANIRTSRRSGIVTIRLRFSAEVAGYLKGEFILPSSATTDISPGGGGGGDEGCTTGESRGWLMLLAFLAVGAVAGRRLRQLA